MLQGRSRRDLHSNAIRHNEHPTGTIIADQFFTALETETTCLHLPADC
jgi:hypothetical protein